MLFLFATIATYYLLMGGAAHLLVHGSAEQQLDQASRRRPAVGVVYWLLTAPLLCTGLLGVFSSRWSLSTALLPAALVLLLLSGLAAGVYGRVAQLRWPLLTHAALLGLAAPAVVQRLWLGQQEAGILYRQYPFTVKAARRDYVDASWSWDDEPTSYAITALYQTSWGFDYYVGDLHLSAPPRPYHYGNSPQEVTGMGESFWQRVRSLQFSPDSTQGRLKCSSLLSAGKYNAFTERVELPAEQVVNFWLDTSLEQRKRPTPY
jgi:hypothetical protein